MDDLTQQLNQILSNPQTMGQLQKLLGGGEDAATPQESSAGTPDLSALLGALGAGSQQQPSSGLAALSPQTLTALTRLAPLLSQVNQEDDATRLLRALRPLLSQARQKKVDEALKILQMLRLLPLLKESGVLSGLLSGLL